nr:MAG TPA: hypothetical protein [Caudoviricetes sp.]
MNLSAYSRLQMGGHLWYNTFACERQIGIWR